MELHKTQAGCLVAFHPGFSKKQDIILAVALFPVNPGYEGWKLFLSGGERQRISIARALLKDAPIVLLDEATASLDVENETKIQAGISELIKHKTVLIIAHRMRTIAHADKIVVLKDGHVAETGNPEELKKQNGLFCQMMKRQVVRA